MNTDINLIKLTLNGDSRQVHDFVQNFRESSNNITSPFYPMNYGKITNLQEDYCTATLKIESNCQPTPEWIDQFTTPLLKISISWHKKCEELRRSPHSEDAWFFSKRLQSI